MTARLLIVDDEREYAESLADRLSLRGFRVRTASSGGEGLTAIQEEPVDLVILDLSMPGMDGLETLRHIRAGQGDETEIILLTGHASLPTAIEGMKRGAFDYLEKPVELARLVEVIQRAKDHRARRLERLRMMETGRLTSLAQMAMGVAHELNNPLNTILNETGWIQELIQQEQFQQCSDVDEVGQSLALIARQVKRCKEITLRLLALRRPQLRQPETLDLNALLENHLDSHRDRAEKLGVQILTQPAADLPPLTFSPMELEEVLLHVINNALDAMEEAGGTLTVRTRAETDLVVVEIEDTGRGISEGARPHIFEPFYSTRALGHGNGLGLSIAQSIMLSRGGDIVVTSQEGQGTRVTLKIPCHSS